MEVAAMGNLKNLKMLVRQLRMPMTLNTEGVAANTKVSVECEVHVER